MKNWIIIMVMIGIASSSFIKAMVEGNLQPISAFQYEEEEYTRINRQEKLKNRLNNLHYMVRKLTNGEYSPTLSNLGEVFDYASQLTSDAFQAGETGIAYEASKEADTIRSRFISAPYEPNIQREE